MSDKSDASLTTYKRADGEQIDDNWDWVVDLEFFDDDPVELVEEVWVRQSTRTFWHLPSRFYDCDVEWCDNDAVAWRLVAKRVMWQVCEEHNEPTPISKLGAAVPVDRGER